MYIANVENSEIDVSGIRTILVQGDSAYPSIRFVLDPSLTGLSWRVRGTYLSSNIAVTSPELVATETASSVALDWSVASDFTTYSGEMQLSLVGANELGTVITKALGEITIQKDYSLGEHQNITLDLFEQLMAQANAAISKYPTIIGGNWYVWNVTVGEYQDTGVAASSQWKSGTGITGTSTTPTAFPSSGITMSNVGDMYLNSSTGYTYRCTLSGAAAVALWVYVSNITGPQGIPGTPGANGTNGVGVPVGGAIRQALVKSSATDYDAGWADAQLQYSTMPTAAAENLGQVAQFTGSTGTYTHGHVYECVSSGGGSPTYSWSEIVYGDPNSVSYSAQSKTAAEKAQARTNIAATESLQANVTIYVSTTGSDTTGDGSSASPYATVNYAVSKIPRVLSGYDCTINIAAGTYSEDVVIKGYASGRIALSLGGAVTFNSLLISGFGTYVTCGSSAMLTCAWIAIQAGALFDRYSGQITLTGETTISGVKASLHCSLASVCNSSTPVTVNNSTGAAIGAYQFGRISISVLAGTGNTGNRINVYSGGICVYDAASSTINVTATYTTSGGKIYSGAQTSVPNY